VQGTHEFLPQAAPYLEGKQIPSLAEYAKSSKQSHSNLLNKEKRQTIEAFWERGVWKIGA
jgi:hypothetical protein